MKIIHSKLLSTLSVASVLLLSACNDDKKDDDKDMASDTDTMTDTMVETTASYKVDITNLTQGQPMSPFALIGHDSGMLFNIGEQSSTELEYIAEGGNTAMLLAASWVEESVTDSEALMPGSTVTLMLDDADVNYLSLVSMLVATNDGFTGVNGYDVSMLVSGDSVTLMGKVYDAGTEVNSEMAGTMPGVNGGEGYNSERVDTNIVTMHQGVVSVDDGLTQSVLTSHHRFDNPAIKVVITKM